MANDLGDDSLFGDSAGAFLNQLARNNNRAWFTSHREEYDDLIAEPLNRLLESVDHYGPGRVMRPNRDVRFSPDKSPYKTTASMWAGAVSGVYLQLNSAGLQAGGGLYDPTRDQLQRAREAIDSHPTAAAGLDKVLRKLELAGFEVAGPSLTTAPRGYPRDHPAIALLRLRHFAVTTHLPLTATMNEIHGVWKAVAPLNRWVDEQVGAALAWP